MSEKQKIYFEITALSVLKVIGLVLVIWFLYYIRDILGILFVAIILAAAIDPVVSGMNKRKIPRGLGVIIVYLALLALVSLTVALIIPPMINEISDLASKFPVYWQKISDGFQYIKEYAGENQFGSEVSSFLEQIQGSLKTASVGIFGFLSSVFGGIFSLVAVLVIAFYLVVSEEGIKKIFKSVAPSEYQSYLSQLFLQMQKKIGDWVRGQLILMVVIGFLTFIGLFLMGVKYAVVLGLLAGLFEVIPYIGPVMAAIPAIFLTFVQSPLKAITVIGFFILIQWIENNILVPKIMEKTVGLNPVIIIVVLMIGLRIAGVVGMILSVPVATAISVAVKDYYKLTETPSEPIQEN